MPNRGIRRGGGRVRTQLRTIIGALLALVLCCAAVSMASVASAVTASPAARTGASAISATSVSDDSDPALSYSGAWAAISSGGERMTALTGPGSVEYRFAGTSVSWTGLRSPGAGTVEVSIDGVRMATVDGYARAVERTVLFSTSGLTDAAHTLRLVSAGGRNPLSSGSMVTVAAFGTTTEPAAGSGGDGIRLDIDPTSQVARAISASAPATRAELAPLSTNAVASWFGDWNDDVRSAVSSRVAAADGRGAVATLVMYAIPHRDCGGYSAGAAMTAGDYRTWVADFVAGLGTSHQIVIVEPDAVMLTDCLSATQRTERSSLLRFAVESVAAQGSAVYLDAGHSAWLTAAQTAERLRAAGIASATGFSLNVSNTQPTAREVSHGTAVSDLLGGTHFVIDTGRNGGSVSAGQWCNPAGAGLGAPPTTETGSPLIDAYLWIKPPGESDGTCNGGPPAGQWFESYARALVANAAG